MFIGLRVLGGYTGQICSLSNGHAENTVSLFDISAGKCHSRYPVWVKVNPLDYAIDGHESRSAAYYINHAAKKLGQNAIFKHCEAIDRREVLVFARKKIQKGEEILCSYGG